MYLNGISNGIEMRERVEMRDRRQQIMKTFKDPPGAFASHFSKFKKKIETLA